MGGIRIMNLLSGRAKQFSQVSRSSSGQVCKVFLHAGYYRRRLAFPRDNQWYISLPPGPQPENAPANGQRARRNWASLSSLNRQSRLAAWAGCSCPLPGLGMEHHCDPPISPEAIGTLHRASRSSTRQVEKRYALRCPCCRLWGFLCFGHSYLD